MCKRQGKLWRRMTVLLLTVLLLISTTACSKHYVVVKGEEMITVKKSTLDTLIADNELLIQQCGSK